VRERRNESESEVGTRNEGKVAEWIEGREKGETGAKKEIYLKYRHTGSATLKSNTPGGSTILKHFMVAKYWERMS